MTFFNTSDYKAYLRLLSDCSQRNGLDIPAYCLMPNHGHIICIPQEKDALARTFGQVHAAYAKRVNRRYNWQGHLWQERFHSYVMDERHLLWAVLYVLHNPVKAGLATYPWDWPFSSARAHLGLAPRRFLKTDLLDGLVRDWRSFLETPPRATQVKRLREHGLNGRPLGSEAFVEALEARLGFPLRPRRRGRPWPGK